MKPKFIDVLHNVFFELFLTILIAILLFVSYTQYNSTMQQMRHAFFILFFVLLSLSIFKIISQYRTKAENPLNNENSNDAMGIIWSQTTRLMELLFRIITMRAFIVFVTLLIVAIYFEYIGLEPINNFIWAIATSVFTIWLVDLIYSEDMDKLKMKRVHDTLMKIFEHRTWLRSMDKNWRMQAIKECVIASLGEELGSSYAEKTYEKQLSQNSYRTNFKYDIVLQKRSGYEFLGQTLAYKKHIKLHNNNYNHICCIFEFREDPFLNPRTGELVFFQEEIRSQALIYLLQYAPILALKIKDDENLSNAIRKQCNKCFKDALTSYNEDICYGYSGDKALLLEAIGYLWDESIPEIIASVYKDISSISYLELMSTIVTSLLEYRLTKLDLSGRRISAENEKVECIFYTENGDQQITEAIVRGIDESQRLLWMRQLSGVRMVSHMHIDISNTLNTEYTSLFYEVTCGYPIYKQHSFYWKFGEPIIAPSFQMIFPSDENMEDVCTVQYFSDNKQVVSKSNITKTVSFSTAELLLPESGIYIHWPKDEK